MAGIGLRLQQLESRGTYLHGLAAYASAGIIVAGPWLVTIVSLILLDRTAAALLGQADRELLFATITYAFSASLLLTAGPQMVLTRYVADRLYLADLDAIAPTCTGVLLVSAPVLLALMSPFLVLAPFDVGYRVLAYCLLSTTSMLWLIGVIISAARDYVRIVLSSITGYGLGLVAAVWLGHHYGLKGALGGFVLGQFVWLALFVEHIYREFPSSRVWSFDFLSYWRKFWDLGLAGAVYYFGLWADKIIYWMSPSATVVHDFYRIYPRYDSVVLVSSLLMIPASSLLLVHAETGVASSVRDFVAAINGKHGYAEITQERARIAKAMNGGLLSVTKLHVGASMLALAAAAVGQLPFVRPEQNSLLKVVVLASGGQLILFVTTLFLLYLDQRRPVLTTMVTFAAMNVIATAITLRLGEDWYGFGYLVAVLCGAVVALVFLRRRLGRLEYITFMSQPLVTASE